VAAYA
jgi:glyoxylase-like metal-dependent hydrolase (beta-lactamase superfamily II)